MGRDWPVNRVNDLITMHIKQAAYRTYVIGMRVPRDSVSRGLYWDTLDPYRYIRLQSSRDSGILIVGGEDHKTSQADDDTMDCFYCDPAIQARA